MEMQALMEIEDRSVEFLTMVYLKVRENRHESLIFRKFYEAAHTPVELQDRVEDFLRNRDRIKRLTGGGIDGSFKLTHEGFLYIEELLINGQVSIERTVEAEDGQGSRQENWDIAAEIEEERQLRDKFLFEVYRRSEGNRLKFVQLFTIANELGLSEAETFNIEEYLKGQYLIERKSMGGLAGSVVMTSYGINLIQDYLLDMARDYDERQESKKRGPNQDTLWKIDKLRAMRLAHIVDGEVRIGWIQACDECGIRSETVRLHAPELRMRWNDPTYLE